MLLQWLCTGWVITEVITWQKDYLVGVTYSNHVRSFKSGVFSAAGSRSEKSERFKALEGFYAPCWLEDGGATWQGICAASRSWEQISSWQPARKWGPQSWNSNEVIFFNNVNENRRGQESFNEIAALIKILIQLCETLSRELSHVEPGYRAMETVRKFIYIILRHCTCDNLLHSSRKLIQLVLSSLSCFVCF